MFHFVSEMFHLLSDGLSPQLLLEVSNSLYFRFAEIETVCLCCSQIVGLECTTFVFL